MIALHLGSKILTDADGLGGVLGAGVEPQAGGGGERHHRGANAVLVHQLDVAGRRPVEHVRIGRDVPLAISQARPGVNSWQAGVLPAPPQC